MSLIRERRRELEMTQARLAALTGLDDTVISKIETGARKLTVDELVIIAKALECGPSALIPLLTADDDPLSTEEVAEHA